MARFTLTLSECMNILFMMQPYITGIIFDGLSIKLKPHVVFLTILLNFLFVSGYFAGLGNERRLEGRRDVYLDFIESPPPRYTPRPDRLENRRHRRG